MENTTTTIRISDFDDSEDFEAQIVGHTMDELENMDVDFGTCYPEIDPDGHIIGVSEAEGQDLVLVDWVNGHVSYHECACDAVINAHLLGLTWNEDEQIWE